LGLICGVGDPWVRPAVRRGAVRRPGGPRAPAHWHWCWHPRRGAAL